MVDKMRAIVKPEYIITSSGEISEDRLAVEFMAPEMNKMESKKITIEIVEREAFERIQTWLAMVALPLKNLKTWSEKDEAITQPI